MSRINWDWTSIDKAVEANLGPRSDFWRPVPDVQTHIRLLPGLDSNPPYVDVYRHYNVIEKGTVRCRGKGCPICKVAKFLIAHAKALPDGNALKRAIMGGMSAGRWQPGEGSGLRCNFSRYHNIIVRDVEDPVVQVWVSTGGFVGWYESEVKARREISEDWNPWNPDAGYDLSVSYYPRKPAQQKYKYIYHPDPSPIGLEGWENMLHDLKAVATEPIEDTPPEVSMRLMAKEKNHWLQEQGLPTVEEILGEEMAEASE